MPKFDIIHYLPDGTTEKFRATKLIDSIFGLSFIDADNKQVVILTGVAKVISRETADF